MKKNLVLMLIIAMLATLVLGSVSVSAAPKALNDYEAISDIAEVVNGVAPNPCYLTYALETENAASGSKSIAFMINPDNADNGHLYMKAPGGAPNLAYVGYDYLGVRMKNTDSEFAIGFSSCFHNGEVWMTSWDYDIIMQSGDSAVIPEYLDETTMIIPEGFDGTIYFPLADAIEAATAIVTNGGAEPAEIRVALVDVDGGWEGKVLWDDAALYMAADVPTPEDGGDSPAAPQVLTGTPTIDGVLDGIYTADGSVSTVVGPAFFPMNCELTDSNATATSYLLHDATNLYIATVVKDATPLAFVQREGDGSWMNDAVEIYLSDISDLSKVSVGNNGTVFVGEDVTAAAAATADGYIVEMAIPLREGATKGGIGLQLNDLIEDDDTQKIVAHGVQAVNFQFELSDDVAEVPAPSVEPSFEPSIEPSVEPSVDPSTAPTESDEPTDAATGPDLGLIIGIVAGVLVIAAVVVFIVVKNKKKGE